MQITPTRLPEVLEITPRRFGDDRGFFSESWNRDSWIAAGIDLDFCQDNHSLSAEVGVLRGLHFQAPPRAQDKLVRVITGAVLDVAVDIRKGSPRYGEKGFAHGFLTLKPDTHFLYKCTDTYAPDAEGALLWSDADIGVDWGVDAATLTLSEKDAIAPAFKDFDSPFIYEG